MSPAPMLSVIHEQAHMFAAFEIALIWLLASVVTIGVVWCIGRVFEQARA